MQENNQTPPKGDDKINPSDTQKVIEQHLNDENHEITDEQIRSVKVGAVDDPNTVGAELQARLEEKRKSDEDAEEASHRKDEDPAARRVTPWDTID